MPEEILEAQEEEMPPMPEKVTHSQERERFEQRYPAKPEKDNHKELGKQIIVSGIVALAVLFGLGNLGGGSFVTKQAFETNIKNITSTLTTATADITKQQADAKKIIDGIPAQVSDASAKASAQLATQVNGYSSQISTASTNAQNAVSKVDGLTAKVDSLTTQLAELKNTNAAYEARIKALETPSTSGTTSVGSLPAGMSINAQVIDEGTLVNAPTDNRTQGEIKVTMVNNGTKDLEDVVISLYVYVDNASSAPITLTASGYGTWNIRTRQSDEIEIRGRLTRLIKGETRKIYLSVFSQAIVPGEATYIDVSNSDVELISWDYAS